MKKLESFKVNFSLNLSKEKKEYEEIFSHFDFPQEILNISIFLKFITVTFINLHKEIKKLQF